jgi:O-acetyl-ADP-ribose deacetylase
LNKT